MKNRLKVHRLIRGAAMAALLMLTTGGAAASVAAPAAAMSGDGPHFYSGVAIDIAGTVNGDVYAAGQSVTVSGNVIGDVIAAAQTITVTGTVDGNVRLAAQDVTLAGGVSQSGTIFASNVVVPSQGSIRNDLVATGSSIRIAGVIGRDLVANAAKLTIDGTVAGDVTYSSDSTATIADGAVTGTVQHVQPQRSSSVEISPWAVFLGWLLGILYALIALSVVTVAAALLVPRMLERVTDQLLPSPWRALLVGFIAALAVPFALLFLLVTIIGAPLALAGILIWAAMTLATFLFGAHYLGRLVLRGPHHPVLTSFIGGLILIVGLQIPWLNIPVWLAMVFFGLGAQLLEIRRHKPWAMNSGPGTPQPLSTAEPAPAAGVSSA